MKKLTSILLAITLVFMFVACGDKNEQPETDDTIKNSFVDSVLKGKIPEAEHSLGTPIEDIEEYYNNLEKQMEESHQGEGHVHDDADILLNKSGGELTYSYEIGAESYHYEKAKKSKGISVICTLEDAFGFKNGTSKLDIETSLSGLELKTVQAGEDELYFVPLSEAIILRYKTGEYRLDFYFSNNELVATVLLNTQNWTV